MVAADDSMPALDGDVPAAGSARHDDDRVHAEPLAAPAVAHARCTSESLTVCERCVALRLILGQGTSMNFDVARCVPNSHLQLGQNLRVHK